MPDRRKPSAVLRFANDRGGVSAVEFGALALPFFLILAACLEGGVAFLAEMSLGNAVDKIGRQVRTGEVKLSNMSESQFRAKLCAEASAMFTCSKINLDLREYQSYKDLPSGPPVTGTYGSQTLNVADFTYKQGGAAKIMALQAYYEWPVVFDIVRKYLAGQANGTFLIGATVAFKTESFE